MIGARKFCSPTIPSMIQNIFENIKYININIGFLSTAIYEESISCEICCNRKRYDALAHKAI